MQDKLTPLLSGEVLEEEVELSVEDVRRVSRLTIEEIHIIVEEGIIEPIDPDAVHWRFHGASLQRVRRAVQLRRDLGVNWAGAALALELLDELHELRVRIRRFEVRS